MRKQLLELTHSFANPGAVPDSWEDLDGNAIAPQGSAGAAYPEAATNEVTSLACHNIHS